MNADIIGTVFVDLDRDRVVDVLRTLRINCEDALAPEILANLKLALRDTKGAVRCARRNVIKYYSRPGHRR